MTKGGVRCPICEEAERIGYMKVTHCEGCHRTHDAAGESHCTDCHRHFGSDKAFLSHRVGDQCRDLTGLTDKEGRPRYRIELRQHGAVWVQTDYREFARKGH